MTRRLLLTICCWLAFAVAPGETQRSMTEDIPPIVGNERAQCDDGRPCGWVGMTGPCGGVVLYGPFREAH